MSDPFENPFRAVTTFLTPQQLLSTTTSRIVGNSLSIFGSVFNLITIFHVRTSTAILRKMIVSLCVMDLIFNILSMFSILSTENELLCSSLGFLVLYGYNGSIVLTCCFAHCLNSTLKRSEAEANTGKLWKIYQILGFVSPIILSGIATGTQYYRVQDNYCWHYPSDEAQIDWQDFFLSFLPTTIAVLYCMYCYLSVIRKLREMGMRVYLELLFYPLILIICSFPWNAYSLYSIFSTQPPPFDLFVIANVMLSMQGFFNALAYGLSRTIISGYKRLFCERRKRQQSSLTPEPKMILAPSEIRSSLLGDLAFSAVSK